MWKIARVGGVAKSHSAVLQNYFFFTASSGNDDAGFTPCLLEGDLGKPVERIDSFFFLYFVLVQKRGLSWAREKTRFARVMEVTFCSER